MAEDDDRRKENRRRKQRDPPDRREESAFGCRHIPAGRLGLGREPEVARLHTHRQHHERKRNQGIDIGNDPIRLQPEYTGIVGRQKIAQKTSYDGADSVYGSLFGQLVEHSGLNCVV